MGGGRGGGSPPGRDHIYIYVYVYTCVYSLCTVYMYVTYMYIGAPHSGLCRDSSRSSHQVL